MAPQRHRRHRETAPEPRIAGAPDRIQPGEQHGEGVVVVPDNRPERDVQEDADQQPLQFTWAITRSRAALDLASKPSGLPLWVKKTTLPGNPTKRLSEISPCASTSRARDGGSTRSGRFAANPGRRRRTEREPKRGMPAQAETQAASHAYSRPSWRTFAYRPRQEAALRLSSRGQVPSRRR